MDRRRALADRGAEAVGAGVAAADDHDVLALRADRRLVEVALLHVVRRREVLHRLVDAGELAAGHREVAPCGRAAGEHDRVAVADLTDGHVLADVRVDAELRALFAHLRDALLEVALLHLELGNAVAQQAADPIGALVDGHVVAGARELLRGREPRGPGADHRDALAGLGVRNDRREPALFPRAVDDLDLDLLDRDRRLVDAEHACGLARRRAQPTGELGEVVGGVQPLARRVPVVAVHEVVPLGDEVPERAARVAERDPAVHAARALRAHLVGREVLVDLFPVEHAHRDRAPRRQLPPVLHEPRRLTHVGSSRSSRRC